MNDDCKLIERVADALDEAREDLAGFHAKDMARDILPIIRAAQADAWDEACQAFAWCRDNGPIEDALPYVAEHNPYREKED